MEGRAENNGTGSPRGSRETEAKPSAVQKKIGRTKGYKHTPEARKKMSLAQTPEVLAKAGQKRRATVLKSGRHMFSSGAFAVPSFIDPDFDEGL